MKKLTGVVLVFLMMLSGCLNREVKEVYVTPVAPEKEIKFLYTPGTYHGQSEGYHGVIEVEVVVSESEILSIEVLNHSEQNYLKMPVEPQNPEEENPDDSEDDLEVPQDAEEVEVLGAIDEIVNLMIYEQSTNVDIITNATESCEGVKEAVHRALAEAML